MFTKIEHLTKQLENENRFTQNILDALTDESLAQAINKDHRTIGRLAWHIITTYPEMLGLIGCKIEGVSEKEPIPTKVSDLSNTFKKVTSSLMKHIADNWCDDTLLEINELYGEKWPKGLTLLIFLKHEIHHRGQISVLMRQAGVPVPNIYGPAKEGWAAYGANPPEI